MTPTPRRTHSSPPLPAAALLALALWTGWAAGALGQTDPAAPPSTAAHQDAAVQPGSSEPDSAPAQEAAPAEGALSDEELQALVAPIALYPDVILASTLQASLTPLDVVKADRYLSQTVSDPALRPDPDWDAGVTALLSYPTVIHRMASDLDWTELLGETLLTQLEGVQDAIQELRAFMRAMGALDSNDKITVLAEGDVIRILPADENAVYIPQYDPDALLAALYGADDAAAEDASEEPTEDAASAAETTEDEPVEAEPAAGEAAPATYSGTQPPPVAYSDPGPSWGTVAAVGVGGALIGGILGYAIADDDDDDDDDDDGRDGRGDITIEDSNIVIGDTDLGGRDKDDLKRRLEKEQLKRDLEKRQERESVQRRLNDVAAGKAPNRETLAKKPGQAPLAGKAKPKSAASAAKAASKDKKAVRPGDQKRPQAKSAFGETKSAQEVKRDSNRGLKSKKGGGSTVKMKPKKPAAGVLAGSGKPKKQQAAAQRGKKRRG